MNPMKNLSHSHLEPKKKRTDPKGNLRSGQHRKKKKGELHQTLRSGGTGPVGKNMSMGDWSTVTYRKINIYMKTRKKSVGKGSGREGNRGEKLN